MNDEGTYKQSAFHKQKAEIPLQPNYPTPQATASNLDFRPNVINVDEIESQSSDSESKEEEKYQPSSVVHQNDPKTDNFSEPDQMPVCGEDDEDLPFSKPYNYLRVNSNMKINGVSKENSEHDSGDGSEEGNDVDDLPRYYQPKDEYKHRDNSRDDNLYDALEKDLSKNLDLDHSFDFETEEHKEAGGAVKEPNIEDKKELVQDEFIRIIEETKSKPKHEPTQLNDQEDGMEDIFRPSLFGSTPQYNEEECIETGHVDLNQPTVSNLSNNHHRKNMKIIDMTRSSTSGMNGTPSIYNSEQRRLVMTQNLSQNQQTSDNMKSEGDRNGKRPSTTAHLHQKRPSLADSAIVSHSKGESLRFNRKETESLKEVFAVFDKKNTGYVKEDDLLRILDIMNKDNEQVSDLDISLTSFQAYI